MVVVVGATKPSPGVVTVTVNTPERVVSVHVAVLTPVIGLTDVPATESSLTDTE